MKHRPHQRFCTVCKSIKKQCNYNFSKMKVISEYPGVSILVKCDKFELRTEVR